MGRLSRTSGRVVGLLAGLAASIALGEFLVRVCDVPPRPLEALSIPTFQLSENPIRRFEYRPNLGAGDAFITPSYEGLRTNSRGFRDVEWPRDKPRGTTRIAVLGDSVAAGYGISSAEDLFVPLLEKRLRAVIGEPLEVLNFGVAGYQTMQEVETLREVGLDYAPDLVLVVFCINDTRVAGYDRFIGQLVKQGEQQSARRTLLGRTLGTSRLALVLYHGLRSLLPGPGMDRYQRDFLGGRSPVEAGLELLAELEREHGFAPLLVIVPGFDGVFSEYHYQSIHAEALAAAARHGVPAVDLTAAFAARSEDATEFSFDRMHFNARGHAVMAEILEPLVLEQMRAHSLSADPASPR